MKTIVNIPTRTVTDFDILIGEATRNIQYFHYPNKFSSNGTMLIKGCRKCNKLVDYNNTKEPRFTKESTFFYVCSCKECETPMLLNSIDFYLLKDKV